MIRFAAPVVLALFALAARAPADPTRDLLRLVPPDSTVCFVVPDLRGTASRLLDSPFAEWFRTSDFGRALLAHDDLKQLGQAQDTLTTHLGVTAAEVRDDVFGDAVVLAYQARSGDGESGVILFKARKPDLLKTVTARLNDAQAKAGEVTEVRAKTHAGQPYGERVKAGGASEFFLTRDDGTFAFSAQEAVIRQVIDRLAKPTNAVADRYAALGVKDAAAVVLFDPRAVEAELTAAAKASGDENEKAILDRFAQVWAAADAIGLTLRFDRHAELSAVAAFDPKKLPAELHPLLTGSDGGSTLWSVIPDDALFATAGRLDLPKVLSVVESFLSDAARDGVRKATAEAVRPVIGKDALGKAATGLGPDWGLWVTAPEKGDGPLPTVTFALRVRPAGSTDSTVGDALVSGLEFAASLFRFEYNRSHDDEFTLTAEKHDDGSVRVLKNDAALPPGVRPAFGLRGDFLVIATAPKAVSGFRPPDVVKGSPPLARVSAARFARYLKSHGRPLSERLSGGSGEKAAGLERQFTEFATVLELFDRIELRHAGDGRVMTLTVRVETVQPLRK